MPPNKAFFFTLLFSFFLISSTTLVQGMEIVEKEEVEKEGKPEPPKWSPEVLNSIKSLGNTEISNTGTIINNDNNPEINESLTEENAEDDYEFQPLTVDDLFRVVSDEAIPLREFIIGIKNNQVFFRDNSISKNQIIKKNKKFIKAFLHALNEVYPASWVNAIFENKLNSLINRYPEYREQLEDVGEGKFFLNKKFIKEILENLNLLCSQHVSGQRNREDFSNPYYPDPSSYVVTPGYFPPLFPITLPVLPPPVPVNQYLLPPPLLLPPPSWDMRGTTPLYTYSDVPPGPVYGKTSERIESLDSPYSSHHSKNRERRKRSSKLAALNSQEKASLAGFSTPDDLDLKTPTTHSVNSSISEKERDDWDSIKILHGVKKSKLEKIVGKLEKIGAQIVEKQYSLATKEKEAFFKEVVEHLLNKVEGTTIDRKVAAKKIKKFLKKSLEKIKKEKPLVTETFSQESEEQQLSDFLPLTIAEKEVTEDLPIRDLSENKATTEITSTGEGPTSFSERISPQTVDNVTKENQEEAQRLKKETRKRKKQEKVKLEVKLAFEHQQRKKIAKAKQAWEEWKATNPLENKDEPKAEEHFIKNYLLKEVWLELTKDEEFMKEVDGLLSPEKAIQEALEKIEVDYNQQPAYRRVVNSFTNRAKYYRAHPQKAFDKLAPPLLFLGGNAWAALMNKMVFELPSDATIMRKSAPYLAANALGYLLLHDVINDYISNHPATDRAVAYHNEYVRPTASSLYRLGTKIFQHPAWPLLTSTPPLIYSLIEDGVLNNYISSRSAILVMLNMAYVYFLVSKALPNYNAQQAVLRQQAAVSANP